MALKNFISDINVYLNENIDNNVNIKLKSIIKFLSIGIQNEINAFCCLSANKDVLNKHTGEMINRSLIPEKTFLDEIKPCKYIVNIKKDPVLTSLWNEGRQFDNYFTNVGKINNNPFDGLNKKHRHYIHSIRYLPLGIVVVTQRNHSINAAIIHNEGFFECDRCIDMRRYFNNYFFDGIKYKKNGLEINDDVLYGGCRPFDYRFGVLFELGKILNQHNITL